VPFNIYRTTKGDCLEHYCVCPKHFFSYVIRPAGNLTKEKSCVQGDHVYYYFVSHRMLKTKSRRCNDLRHYMTMNQPQKWFRPGITLILSGRRHVRFLAWLRKHTTLQNTYPISWDYIFVKPFLKWYLWLDDDVTATKRSHMIFIWWYKCCIGSTLHYTHNTILLFVFTMFPMRMKSDSFLSKQILIKLPILDFLSLAFHPWPDLDWLQSKDFNIYRHLS
jgi:hypothetical protein